MARFGNAETPGMRDSGSRWPASYFAGFPSSVIPIRTSSGCLWVKRAGPNRLANALMERRISVSTAEPFCVSATIPQALRIALGSVPFDSLRPALLSVRDAVEYEQYR